MAWTAPVTQTTGTLITAAIWNAQVTDNMTYLKAFGQGMIVMFDVACPTGWTRVSAWDGKFVRGAATYGGTGGADTHTHTGPSHTHAQNMSGSGGVGSSTASPTATFALDGNNNEFGAPIAGAQTLYPVRTGVVAGGTGATGAGSTLPAYVDVVFCKKD